MDNKSYRQPTFYMIEDKREELKFREQIKNENYLDTRSEKVTKDYVELLNEVWR